MKSGRLRHRIIIDQNTATGTDEHGITYSWVEWATVKAEVAPISGAEFLAGQGIVSQVIATITIRFKAGVAATMRIRHQIGWSPDVYDLYNIRAVLPDKKMGREYLTLMCSRGVNEG